MTKITKTQKDYIDFLDNLESKITTLPAINSKSFKLDDAKTILKETELLVPIVGGFSAGKSTLLNSFLGKDYLGVALRPETALATELRYGFSEYIELVDEKGQTTKLDINDKDSIKDLASQNSYARFYINNQKLKDIEPIILVDMPGFESPQSAHNKAILEYIQRGVFFIVLQDVLNGNLTASILRELDNLQTFKKRFRFFLSKVNLKPKTEVEEIISYVQNQLSDTLDVQDKVLTIDKDGGKNLEKIIKEIDPENLSKEIFLPSLKEIFRDVKEKINTSISALEQNESQNQEDLDELNRAIARLEKEQDSMLAEIKRKYDKASVESILSNLGSALSRSIDELARSYKTSGQAGLEITINDISQNAISKSVSSIIKDINIDISSIIGANLSSLQNTMNRLSQSTDFTALLSAKSPEYSAFFNNILQKTEGLASTLKSRGGGLATIGTLLTGLNPVLKIASLLLTLLPDILSSMFGPSQEEKERMQLEKIKEEISCSVIPQVKASMRKPITNLLDEQIDTSMQAAIDAFKQNIDQKRSAITAIQKEKESKKENVHKELENYKTVLADITSLATQTIFKG
ncbi:dynamin family protein [Helicobacter sp. 11S02629-2]|uniref:dynamin family protein n=1 Tax=Helicobacter sp. 11S02629-2 TaxID=1476195 RepID=UPI000BA6F1DB|nr:dynamin family protein [Helicobacter sp. 11S02629-2]PAF44911.1 hypothetical protein BKH40_04280 [Helicobacter sp. 11S02629-2]